MKQQQEQQTTKGNNNFPPPMVAGVSNYVEKSSWSSCLSNYCTHTYQLVNNKLLIYLTDSLAESFVLTCWESVYLIDTVVSLQPIRSSSIPLKLVLTCYESVMTLFFLWKYDDKNALSSQQHVLLKGAEQDLAILQLLIPGVLLRYLECMNIFLKSYWNQREFLFPVLLNP